MGEILLQCMQGVLLLQANVITFLEVVTIWPNSFISPCMCTCTRWMQ